MNKKVLSLILLLAISGEICAGKAGPRGRKSRQQSASSRGVESAELQNAASGSKQRKKSLSPEDKSRHRRGIDGEAEARRAAAARKALENAAKKKARRERKNSERK